MEDWKAWQIFLEWKEKEGISLWELSDEEILSLIRYVMSKKGIRNKLCPLLEGLGVFESDTACSASFKDESLNWIKSICRECPLEDGCIYDYSGKVRNDDRDKLIEQLTRKLKEVQIEGSYPKRD